MSETITVKVYLCAFRYASEPVEVREVAIPADEYRNASSIDRCELAFHYGQNDVTPIAGVRSVSVDDVVELPNGPVARFVVAGCGFEELGCALEDHARKVGRTPEDGGILIRGGKVVRPC